MEIQAPEDSRTADSWRGLLFGIAWIGGSPAAKGHWIRSKSRTPVYKDNTACIEWTNNVIRGRVRAKHIDYRKHFKTQSCALTARPLLWHPCHYRVSTSDQLADLFAKSLQPKQHAALYFQASDANLIKNVGPHEGKRDSQSLEFKSRVELHFGWKLWRSRGEQI